MSLVPGSLESYLVYLKKRGFAKSGAADECKDGVRCCTSPVNGDYPIWEKRWEDDGRQGGFCIRREKGILANSEGKNGWRGQKGTVRGEDSERGSKPTRRWPHLQLGLVFPPTLHPYGALRSTLDRPIGDGPKTRLENQFLIWTEGVSAASNFDIQSGASFLCLPFKDGTP